MNHKAEKNAHFLGVVNFLFNLSQYHIIYDLACGKGELAYILYLEGYSVRAIDIARRNSPFLEDINFHQYDLRKELRFGQNSLVLSVHACGTLTDRIIQLALESQNDFAVMSCCHSDQIYFCPQNMPSSKLLNIMGRDEYLDQIRLSYILEQKYQAGIAKIEPGITPKNRIIWGKAKNSH